MDPPVSFGDWLQQRRKAQSLSRMQLAERVGCSVSALRKIEGGERRPSVQVAALLANSLGLPSESQSTFVRVARGELGVERLSAPAEAPTEPALASPAAPSERRVNLPVHPTPLLGRRRELAELELLLRDPQCRLITLVGPGGVGKTRLAVEAAARSHPAFPDGAAFVSLAPLSSIRFMAPAVAEALRFSFSGPADPQTQLAAYLRGKQLLLVLDNIEHLLAEGAGEWLAELLLGAPRVKLLVTSREVLNVQAEWVFVLSGLPVADDGDGDGVQLFVQRAQRAHVSFVPTIEDEQAIRRISQMVDGLPLAIELAAAWVRTLSCAEIADEIERNPAGLASTMRDVPARHRSLKTVFDHSWALLSSQEQTALMRLSVFRGGFARDAAAEAAGATLELLSGLVAKSLARRGAGGRYDLHELVRQDARDRLRQAGEEGAARQAHGDWFLNFARTAKSHLYTSRASAWLDLIELEHHNLRAALHWFLEPAEGAAPGECLAAGLSLLVALSDFYFVRGHHHEALAFFEQFLSQPATAHCPRQRLAALTQASYFYYVQGRLAEANTALDEAFALNRPPVDREQLARGLEHRALVAGATGDLPAARETLRQSLTVWRELKAGFQQAEVLGHLGDIALAQNDHELAETLYELAINPVQDLPEAVQHPYPPRRLAYLVLRRGEHARAFDLACQSLRLNLAIQDSRAVAACLVALASVAEAHHQPVRAARLCGAAEAILHAMGANLLPPDQVEYDRTVAALNNSAGAADLEAAWAEGRSLAQAQAVEEALRPG